MKRKLHLFLAWLIPLFLMALIFYFSSQNSADSTEVSRSMGGTVLGILKRILSAFGISTKSLPTAEDIDFFLRKTAHFTIYTALGGSVYHAFRTSRLASRQSLIFAPLWCFIYSVSDEFHQLFTDGRSAQVTDVVLDTLGGIVGTLLALLLWKKFAHKKPTSHSTLT